MSTKPSSGRSASGHPQVRCSYTFADGRRCRMPRRSGHLSLCAFHADKEAKLSAQQQAGEDMAAYFYGPYTSACSINGALARVFRGVIRGEIKPKTAIALAYLGQTILHSLPIAENEFCQALGSDTWRREVRHYINKINTLPDIPYFPPPDPQPAPVPMSKPVLTTGHHSDARSKTHSETVTIQLLHPSSALTEAASTQAEPSSNVHQSASQTPTEPAKPPVA